MSQRRRGVELEYDFVGAGEEGVLPKKNPPKRTVNWWNIIKWIIVGLAIAIAITALVLIVIVFPFWTNHSTQPNTIITDHSVVIDGNLDVLGEYRIDSADAIRREISTLLSEEILVFGNIDEAATRMESGNFFSWFTGITSLLPIQLPTNLIAFFNQDIGVIQPIMIFLNGIFVISDENVKHDIYPLNTTNALENIMRLSPSSFILNGATKTQTGFIAQNVQSALPSAVLDLTDTPTISANGVEQDNAKAIDLIQIVAELTAAVQELYHRAESTE